MKMKLCEIVTDCDKIDAESLNRVFETKDAIRDYAYIIHDSEETRPHYHIALRFNNSYDSKYIAQWFGVPENFVNKVKGRWSDMLKYLTHANASDKFQYDESLVVSNFEWKDVIVKDDARKGFNKRKEDIINQIVNGEIRAYNYTDHVSPIENDRYRSSIDRAFNYRMDKVKEAHRLMDAVFITGKAGCGKTTYAKQIAEDRGYSYYVSSSSNDVLDDYKGQDCVILDDLRGSSIGLSDLLKMLDNHTSSTVKSRYKNKVLECKLIIITTVLDVDTFFNKVFEAEDEPISQLKRRCTTYIHMKKEHMEVQVFNPKTNEYGTVFHIENPIDFHKDIDWDEVYEEQQIMDVLGTNIKLKKLDKPVEEFVQIDVDDEDIFHS